MNDNIDRKETMTLPEGIKLRKFQFGANPVSPLVEVPPPNTQGAACHDRAEFKVRWHDEQQGLWVTVCERDDNGHLIAYVDAADAKLLHKASVSVALVGEDEDALIRKSIALDTPSGTGCSGVADFGLLTDVTAKLGAKLGIVAFLMV